MLGYVCSEDTAYTEAMRLTMIDQNCTNVLIDHKPANAIFRPNLTKLLDQLEPSKAVMVDRLNSFGGDMRDVLAMIQRLHEAMKWLCHNRGYLYVPRTNGVLYAPVITRYCCECLCPSYTRTDSLD